MNIKTVLKNHTIYLKTGDVSKKANLRKATLSWADLSGADLSGADLSGANLREANLSGANLSGANLSGANLSKANLSEANLSWVNLSGANLREANITNTRLPHFSIVPQGDIIVFKKLTWGCIATLLIPKEAKRTSSLVGRKCRAEYAQVLSIKDREGIPINAGQSIYNDLDYSVGGAVKPDSYNDDIRIECANGIHFFITEQEALDYCG